LINQVSQGEIVARFGRAAVAAIALSALAMTSTAASAHALTGSTSKGSKGSRMSWGYRSSELTDLSTATPDVFDGAKATAMMLSVGDTSYFRVQISGIGKDASNSVGYGAHLHVGPCVDGDKGPVGAHYNTSLDPVTGLPKVISAKTEVWLDFTVNSDGYARTTRNVQFVPEKGNRAIAIHQDPTNPKDGKAGSKLACLPLEIKSHTSAQ